jgi:hypothetical protein
MKLVAAVSIVALAACGDSPSNSVGGTVGGTSLEIAEAVWAVAPPSSQPIGWTGQAAFVVMSTKPDLCDRVGSNTMLPDEKMLTLEMVDIAGTSTSAPNAPGSYTVPIESYWAPKTAWLWTTSVDAGCGLTGTGAARTGTVTVESIDASAFTGSFDVYIDLAGGGDVTGTFASQNCPGLDNALRFAPPTCTP